MNCLVELNVGSFRVLLLCGTAVYSKIDEVFVRKINRTPIRRTVTAHNACDVRKGAD